MMKHAEIKEFLSHAPPLVYSYTGSGGSVCYFITNTRRTTIMLPTMPQYRYIINVYNRIREIYAHNPADTYIKDLFMLLRNDCRTLARHGLHEPEYLKEVFDNFADDLSADIEMYLSLLNA